MVLFQICGRHLFEGWEFWGVLNVSEVGVLAAQLFCDVFVLWVLRGQHQCWVITQLPQILQSLKTSTQQLYRLFDWEEDILALLNNFMRSTWKTCPVAFSLGFSSSSCVDVVEITSSTFTFARDLAKSSYSWTLAGTGENKSDVSNILLHLFIFFWK